MGFRSFENSGLVISSNVDQVAKISTWIMSVHIIPSIKINGAMNFMVAPCINNIRHFIVQLMHTNYKIIRLLK